MVIIACIDEKGGMLFNNRRQTKDRELIKHIVQLVGDRKLWINSFSSQLFSEYIDRNICVDDNFELKIKEDEYCFIENISPNSLIDKADKVILYNWNRHYPADKFWDVSLEEFEIASCQDIPGSSHEKITERIYVRGNM